MSSRCIKAHVYDPIHLISTLELGFEFLCFVFCFFSNVFIDIIIIFLILLLILCLLLHKIYSIHETNNIHTYKKQSKNKKKHIIIMVSYNYVYTSIITISVTCINEKSIYR